MGLSISFICAGHLHRSLQPASLSQPIRQTSKTLRTETLSRKKAYRQLTKEKANEWDRQYRQARADRTRLLNQIGYFRVRQAELAQEELKTLI